MPDDTILSEPVATPDKKANVSRMWINDTNGNPSMSATFATVAFITTTLIYIASIFEHIGPVSFKSFDAAACSSYLIPTLSLYFGRRWTDTNKTS